MATLDFYGYEVNDILKQDITDHDSIGIERRTNLFPFVDELDYDETDGLFMTRSELIGKHDVIAFQGADDTSGEKEVYWNVAYFNDYDHFGTSYMTASLLAGDYVFDFAQRQSSSSSPIDIRYDIYTRASEEESYVKVASTKSETSETPIKAHFSIGEGGQVKIVVVAHRAANETWGSHFVITEPYLRRRILENAQRTLYVKSLQEQINELRSEIASLGGYNETQTENYSDSVEEVTQ